MKHNHNEMRFSVSKKIVPVYMKATGSNVQIFDNNFHPFEEDDSGIEQKICRFCVGSSNSGKTGYKGAAGCREMHVNAVREAGRSGKPQIYQCELGLMFWASPIYNDGMFLGVLRGSGYLGNKINSAQFAEKCNGKILAEEFMRRVSAFPSGTVEKIRSLAEILLLCAESLSTGNENYHEKFRLRSEQQASLSLQVDELKKKYPKGSTLPSYPLDKERQLIASLYQGDKQEAEKLLNELLAVLVFSNPDHFRYIQLRALELAVLLARTGGNTISNAAAENNVNYFKQIQAAKTVEDLTAALHSMVESIAGQIASFQGIPHALALRKAEAFIRENLTRKINLREIAKVAGLSAPYFSTIFKEEMGENLSRYINRLRVEKSIKMLLETDHTLSEISAACCFQDQSWFSKIFKSFTGVSPGKYRSQGGPLFAQHTSMVE